jgi:hypothetical protein
MIKNRYILKFITLLFATSLFGVSANGPTSEFNLQNFKEIIGGQIDPKNGRQMPIIPTLGSPEAKEICKAFTASNEDIYIRFMYLKKPDASPSLDNLIDYIVKVNKKDVNKVNCSEPDFAPSYFEIPDTGLFLIQKNTGRLPVFTLEVISEQFYKSNPKIDSALFVDDQTGKLKGGATFYKGEAKNGGVFLRTMLSGVYVKETTINRTSKDNSKKQDKFKFTPNKNVPKIFGLTIGVTKLKETVNKYGSKNSGINSVSKGRQVTLNESKINFFDLKSATAIFNKGNTLLSVYAEVAPKFGNFEKILKILKKKYKLVESHTSIRDKIKSATFTKGNVRIYLEHQHLILFKPIYLEYSEMSFIRAVEKASTNKNNKTPNPSLESQL